jgi:uncharacterized protein YndB with AHSA1/START domain
MSAGVPDYVYTIYIAAPAEKVWNALVDGEVTRRYWGHENRSTWKQGARWEHVRLGPSGEVDITGRVIEIDPPRRLVTSWARPGNEDDPSKTSHVTYELTSLEGEIRLTVIHSDLLEDQMREGISKGWPMVLSSLKSLLERGEGLEIVQATVCERSAATATLVSPTKREP